MNNCLGKKISVPAETTLIRDESSKIIQEKSQKEY